MTLSGAIGGTGGLSLTDAGTLILSGSSSYTGPTTISAGTLQLGNGGTTGTLTGAIGIASTLVLDRSGNFSMNNTLAGQGLAG